MQNLAESNGFSVVRDLVGHGIGKEMHEDPMSPSFNRLEEGIPCTTCSLTLAQIEPGKPPYPKESNGFSVVRDLVGHGIGKEMHEDPQVPNYGKAGKGLRLKRNMTLAIEPMINEGTYEVSGLDDGWTVVTDDDGYSYMYL